MPSQRDVEFDRLSAKLLRDVIGAFKALQDDVTLKKISDAIWSRDVTGVVDAIPWERLNGFFTPLKNDILDIVRNEATRLVESSGITFDITNPRVNDWISTHGSELVRNVSASTRDGINTAVQTGINSGRGPRVIAGEIIGKIGLLPNQVKASENYEADLVKQGTDPKRISKLVERYESRQLKSRADNIARTEVINARAAGQQFAWDEKVAEGLIDPQKYEVEWTTAVNEACVRCVPMDGQRREINGRYKNGVARPTLHPRCRCGETLVRRKK